jgi:hypothetical protein
VAAEERLFPFGGDQVGDLGRQEPFKACQAFDFGDLCSDLVLQVVIHLAQLMGLRPHLPVQRPQHHVLIEQCGDDQDHISQDENAHVVVGIKRAHDGQHRAGADDEGQGAVVALSVSGQSDHGYQREGPHEDGLQMDVHLEFGRPEQGRKQRDEHLGVAKYERRDSAKKSEKTEEYRSGCGAGIRFGGLSEFAHGAVLGLCDDDEIQTRLAKTIAIRRSL